MDKSYWRSRKRRELAVAGNATSAEARLIHFDLAGRYCVKSNQSETSNRTPMQANGGDSVSVGGANWIEQQLRFLSGVSVQPVLGSTSVDVVTLRRPRPKFSIDGLKSGDTSA